MSTENAESGNRSAWSVHVVVYAALVLVIAFLGLRLASGVSAQEEPEAASHASGPSADSSGSHAAARIDGMDIGHEEVLERAAPQLEQLEQQRIQFNLQVDSQRHQQIERAVEAIVLERLTTAAAEEAGLEPDAWREGELDRLRAGWTDEEIEAFFTENEDRITGELEDLEEEIRDFLAQQRFPEELKDGHEIEYLLEPYRLSIEPGSGPTRGAAEAPVTIVEWSDFECPYCKQVLPTLEQILDEYPTEVRLVFRHYPLHSIHPNAQTAAEAGVCAQDLGAFWELHDVMFEEQDTLTAADLRDKAERVGLDAEAFAACMEAEDTADRVETDRLAGIGVGVSGTPALFVNGRPLEGAVGFEDLAAVVEDELERAGG